MGANFCWLTFDGSESKETVRDKFDDAVNRSQYEHGHSYSGEIGMANGLRFVDKTFDSLNEAEEWVSENAEKWRHALAVQYKETTGALTWFIGAWCAS